MTGPPANRYEPPMGCTQPPLRALAGANGGWIDAARGRGRRGPTGRHAKFATRCARNGHSPSSAMIASGDLICKEGIMCSGS